MIIYLSQWNTFNNFESWGSLFNETFVFGKNHFNDSNWDKVELMMKSN